jgi:hypothetical protein
MSARRPTPGWVNEVFSSPPRRDVDGRSRPTQRFVVPTFLADAPNVFAEGGNELTAVLMLLHLQRCGFVRRFKVQPFELSEIGGPKRAVPDLFVELASGQVHVVEVKSARYLTRAVEQTLEERREALESAGLDLVLWTDQTALHRPTWHSTRHLARGLALPASDDVEIEIRRLLANGPLNFGELERSLRCGWDRLTAAAARCQFHLSLLETIDEHALVTREFSKQQYANLFAQGDAVSDWWTSLRAA